MSHTPEPWHMDQDHRAPDGDYPIFGPVRGKDGYTMYPRIVSVGASSGHVQENDPDGHYKARDLANARRIVACVNACAGIPTEMLEDADTHVALRVAELEAALEGYMSGHRCSDTSSAPSCPTLKAARAALKREAPV